MVEFADTHKIIERDYRFAYHIQMHVADWRRDGAHEPSRFPRINDELSQCFSAWIRQDVGVKYRMRSCTKSRRVFVYPLSIEGVGLSSDKECRCVLTIKPYDGGQSYLVKHRKTSMNRIGFTQRIMPQTQIDPVTDVSARSFPRETAGPERGAMFHRHQCCCASKGTLLRPGPNP